MATQPTDYLAALALLARNPEATKLFRCDIVNHGRRELPGETRNSYPSDFSERALYHHLKRVGLLSTLSFTSRDRAWFTPSELALQVAAMMREEGAAVG